MAYNLFENEAWKRRGTGSNVLTAEQIAQRSRAIDGQQAAAAQPTGPTQGRQAAVVQQQTQPVASAQPQPVQAGLTFTQAAPGTLQPESLPSTRKQGYDVTPAYTGGTTAQGGMDYLQSLYTSPAEEERLRKASVQRQRILAVGDALRHIGNIYHTVNYAPSQTFTSPVTDERADYEKGKAVRDTANRYYQSYQQARAAQDAKQRQWEATFALNAAKEEREAARKERLADAQTSRWNAQTAKDEANKVYWDTRARLLEAGAPLDQAIKEARRAQIEAQTRLTNIKADQGGFAPKRSGGGGSRRSSGGSKGGKYWDYDEDGNIHYYPNKTMWQQGVEQHGNHLNQNYELPNGTDIFGDQKTVTKKRSSASKGGELARNAEAKKRQAKAATKPKAPAKPASTGQKGNNGKKKIKVNW